MKTTLRKCILLLAGAASIMGCAADEQSVEQRSSEITINPGATYQLRSAATGKCVGIVGNGTANSVNAEIRTCNGSVGQSFTIASVATGYYAIKNTNSLKCLDVTGQSTADGAAVIQYTCNSSSLNQQWSFTDLTGGFERLTAHHSGKVAEVNSGGTADGTTIVQRTWNGATYQQFQLLASGGGGAGGATGTGGGSGSGGAGGTGGTGAIDRAKIALSGTWKFITSDTLTGAEVTTYNDSLWSTVSVPHTWDSVTAVTPHTNSWYRTHFTVSPASSQDRVYVYFEGVFQIADVYVNGVSLGEHRGGFTRFIFDATSAVKLGGADNVLAVKVNSNTCSDCLPDGTPRLYKGYGGIYRNAWLVTTNKYHVATTDYASSGVYVSTPNVTASSAGVSARILLTNNGTTNQTFTVKTVVQDKLGTAVATSQGDVPVNAGTTATTTQTGTVAAPTLWSPANPYLYSVQVSVTVGGVLVDAVTETIGFRTFQLTSTDFTLNGVSTRLRGVCKHQETEYRASAVSAADLTADWDNLSDLGVNFARLVHYPHAQLEYDLADQRGIMVWSENGHTNGGAGTPNGDNINREMVYQNWNHPSIIFWSAGNEASGVAASGEYGSVLKATDPSRPVVYASDGQSPTNIDFIFQNTYAGWYGGSMYDFLTASDHWVSETGAGMAIANHTPNPFSVTPVVNSYEPDEYGALVNEVRFDDMFRNPSHVPAYSQWVFRDVSDSKYKGLLNSKGLLTFAGYKKDAYYHYKSLLQTKPVVRLTGRSYFVRGPDSAGQVVVKAYSNAANLTLKVNGAVIGTRANNLYTHANGTPIKDVFSWTPALTVGKNVISADDGQGNSDTMTMYYLGTGTTLPNDGTGKIANLTSSKGPAYVINDAIWDQRPFNLNFDGTGDNSFDVVPATVAGASFIATKRQSDSTALTNLAFDMTASANLYIMFTKQASTPSWITAAGFADTGVTGQWRDNTPKLVTYSLFKRSASAGTHLTLQPTAIDYVVLIQ
jgi:beta-galactosidase